MAVDTTKEVKAIARHIRMSPFKVRRVLDQIRGRSYREALIILEFMPYRACDPVLKVLRSAVANAEHNAGLNPAELKITQAYANQGPVLKRFQPRAQGRAYQIRKPTCHITIAVALMAVSSSPRPSTKPRRKPTTVSSKPARLLEPSIKTSSKQKKQKDEATQEDFMNKIDAYLIFRFGLIEEKLKQEAEVVGVNSTDAVRLDMLVRVQDPSWEPQNMPDYEETFRLGRSIGCLGSRRTIEALQEDATVIYVEASRPGSGWEGSSPNSPPGEDISPSVPLTVAIKADEVHRFEKGNKALIGIIDSGIDVLHDAFLDSTGTETRILAIWDQTDISDLSSRNTNPLCPYGREYIKNEIDEYIRTRVVPDSLRDLGEIDRKGYRKGGHGTHVTSIAAGRPGEQFLGGIAPEAKIVVVKIDPQSERGIETTHGLALRYIESIAKKVAKLPVVVNVSQGINAGPHDGTSNLECLYNEDFLRNGREPGFAVVKSAGNERQTQRHTKFNVTTKVPYELLLRCGKTSRQEDLVQLWFDPANKLEFCLENPDSELTSWVTLKNKYIHKVFLTRNECIVNYTERSNNNADSVLDISIKRARADFIQDGCWKLHVRKACGTGEEDEIHGWIEIGTSRAVYFEDCCECVTLTTPGTAKDVIVVGSVRSDPFQLDSDSSRGPTRKGGRKPDLVAPGVRIYAAYSGTDSGICPMSGTSMASPHVTGAIALLLSAMENQRPGSRQLNAIQICSAIRQTTQDYTGRWINSMGCGVLNVRGLFEELELLLDMSSHP